MKGPRPSSSSKEDTVENAFLRPTTSVTAADSCLDGQRRVGPWFSMMWRRDGFTMHRCLMARRQFDGCWSSKPPAPFPKIDERTQESLASSSWCLCNKSEERDWWVQCRCQIRFLCIAFSALKIFVKLAHDDNVWVAWQAGRARAQFSECLSEVWIIIQDHFRGTRVEDRCFDIKF